MKVIITGSTGMIGKGVLYECIENSRVTEIICFNRSTMKINHPKVTEVICSDLFELTAHADYFKNIDACFFCIGATVTTLSEQTFRRISVELTLNFANTLARHSPNTTFCYVSGMGIDEKNESKVMWIKIKSEAEQALLKLPLKAFMFRPGYIQPLKGVRSKTTLYRWFYYLAWPFYPLFKLVAPKSVTTTINIGKAMIHIAEFGYKTPYIENIDINLMSNSA